MSLRINDIAPDFTAETTQGPVRFHDWIGDGWAVLFSHPKNFTPVCTTELGAMGGLQPEFENAASRSSAFRSIRSKAMKNGKPIFAPRPASMSIIR